MMRTSRDARRFCRDLARSGAATIPPDHIRVDGHCVGLVARAYLGHAAGYDDAHAMIDAVRAAGQLHTGRAPTGALVFYDGGAHGHVAIKAARFRGIWGTDITGTRYTPNRVGRARHKRAPERLWGYRYVGWCLPEQIPGWS